MHLCSCIQQLAYCTRTLTRCQRISATPCLLCLSACVGVSQAIHTAADLARIHKSKVTVLVVDHKGEGGDPAVKLQVINK